jgi:hypothetical protein
MIANAQIKMCVVVELNKDDVCKLLKGEDIFTETRAHDDQPAFVRVYCSEPNYGREYAE